MAYDATDFVVTETPAPVVRDPRSITDPRERLAYLRDFLRALPEGRFDLQYWFYSPEKTGFGWTPGDWAGETNASTLTHCGTSACIAGHALAIFSPDEFVPDSPRREAAAILGLNARHASELFEPHDLPIGRSRAEMTSAEAANVLDHYLATSKIDWSVA